MIAINASRLWITRHAFQTDGMEQIGFPLVFFERGGFSYHENWYFEMLAFDVVIAIAFVMRDVAYTSRRMGISITENPNVRPDHVYTNVDNEITTKQSDARTSPVGPESES
ncbi:MAG: hypothetical protein R3C03_11395 [Pirellulaceae bacterium]